MTFHIMGGDRRQIFLADYIRAKGFPVCCSYLGEEAPPDWEAEVLILPLPCSRDSIHLNTPLAKERIPLAEIFEKSRSKKIFGGLLPVCAPSGAVDYYTPEELVLGGAASTAEGALALAIENTPFTLLGNPALVLGAGRIGQLLALRLQALGARVTVAARRAESLALCRAMGLEARYYEDLPLGRYRLVFNTVPARVLEEGALRKLPQDALLMELASAPGGFDPMLAAGCGLRVLPAPGLPGKYAPETAAAQIGEFILKEMERLV